MERIKKFITEILNMLSNELLDSELKTSAICLALLVAFAFGCYIYFFYRMCNKTGFYNKNFNRTMAVMSIITAGMVLSMQTNAFVSLGMVGALSIIRFRNVVKDPFDLLFLFWSISTGIICGTGQFKTALLLTVVVTLALLLLERIPTVKSPLLLVVNSTDPNAEEALIRVLGTYAKKHTVKSRNLSASGLDLIIELQTAKEAKLVAECAALPCVTSVSLLSHDGELRG